MDVELIGLKKISHSWEFAWFNGSHASGLSWLVKVSLGHQIPTVEQRVGGHDFQLYLGPMDELVCVSKVWNKLKGEEEHVAPLL